MVFSHNTCMSSNYVLYQMLYIMLRKWESPEIKHLKSSPTVRYIKTINDECLEKLPKNINSQGSPRKEEIQQTSLHKRRKKWTGNSTSVSWGCFNDLRIWFIHLICNSLNEPNLGEISRHAGWKLLVSAFHDHLGRNKQHMWFKY